MKARRKGTNEVFKEIKNVMYENGFIVDAKDLEFEQQQEPTSDHWQEVRERAAIAAMQGLLAHSGDVYTESFIARDALIYADALVGRMKGE